MGSPIKQPVLFGQPVKVNVDDIKADNESFFREQPKEEMKVSVTTQPVHQKMN